MSFNFSGALLWSQIAEGLIVKIFNFAYQSYFKFIEFLMKNGFSHSIFFSSSIFSPKDSLKTDTMYLEHPLNSTPRSRL